MHQDSILIWIKVSLSKLEISRKLLKQFLQDPRSQDEIKVFKKEVDLRLFDWFMIHNIIAHFTYLANQIDAMSKN